MKNTIRYIVLITAAAGLGNTLAADAPDTAEEKPFLTNADFEQPAGAQGAKPNDWVYFSSKYENLAIVTADRNAGGQSIQMAAQGIDDAFQGINQTVPVEERERYTFSAFVKNNEADPLKGGCEGKLVIEWLDELGREISRDESRPWTRNLTKSRWDDVEIKNAKAPSGAVRARFGVLLVESPAGRGSFLIDTLNVTK